MRSILFFAVYALTAEAARFQRASMSIDPSASAPPPKPSGHVSGGRRHGHGNKNNSTFPGPPPNGTHPFNPSQFNSTQGGSPPNGQRGHGGNNVMNTQVIKPSGKPHSKREARKHKAHSGLASQPSGKPHSKREARKHKAHSGLASQPSGKPHSKRIVRRDYDANNFDDFPPRPEASPRPGGSGGQGSSPPPAPSA